MNAVGGEYDVFLSHGTPDKPWVRALAGELEKLGLRVFLDERDLKAGQNWVIGLGEALATSRYLVLILSTASTERPWVIQEWTSYMAEHSPLGRVLPVRIDDVELPTILKATHALDATHRDARRTAAEILACIGDPARLAVDDPRRAYLSRNLVFTLSREDEELRAIGPDGAERRVRLPWRTDHRFGVALLDWQKLCSKPDPSEGERAELFSHARTLGDALFDLLFDEAGREQLERWMAPGQTWRPVVSIRSDDDLLLSLPWELLHRNGSFLVRDQKIDVVRTTVSSVAAATLLRAPAAPFKLVVNVSAPEGSGLSYESESYRITLALAGRCVMVPTELGTVEDLVNTIQRETPRGVHFSGHGAPGALQFEDDEGLAATVRVTELLDRIRERVADEQGRPAFFYLASCHGNTPANAEEGQSGSSSSAAELHRAGVTQVVGYFGPIGDALSTRAEEALYEAIAEGRDTRYAVRQARAALSAAPAVPGNHRPVRASATDPAATAPAVAKDTAPFAWAQLVFYHRGPEFSLSVSAGPETRPLSRELQRTFEGFGDRRVLRTGFIGRRTTLHRVRRRIRKGDRMLVFQGLGGLGKSTLASQVLPMLASSPELICTLWCQETEGVESPGGDAGEDARAGKLVSQLLAFCRARFGVNWEPVVQAVDRQAQDPAERFLLFLQTALQNVPRLVLYLDNLESLLVGPEDDDATNAFGEWISPDLQAIWDGAEHLALSTDKLYLVASTRYLNKSYEAALAPVPPLPGDALFRLTEWFPSLRKLSVANRARLTGRLDGHPRAVEYAADLVAASFQDWESAHGEWQLREQSNEVDIQREWEALVKPALPEVEKQLRDNLLLDAIWRRVLDDRARRMLYRMTLLRRPAEWELLELLGDDNEATAVAAATAGRLLGTSLLERLEQIVNASGGKVRRLTRFALHPATRKFVMAAFGDAPGLRLAAHLRLGEFLEEMAKASPYIETDLEAGHHLLMAHRYDRAYELLGSASDWLRNYGKVREGLDVLGPFLVPAVMAEMDRALVGRLLGTVGLAYADLGQVQKAIGFYEQRLEIAREIGDRRGEGNAVGNLGSAYDRLGQVQKAIGFYEQSLAIAREIGDRSGESVNLGNLGLAYADLGQVQKAIGFYEQSLAIDREIGDRRGEGKALGNLGTAYHRLGQVERAIGIYEQRIVIAREIGDRRGEGSALGNLGLAYARLGQVEKAIGFYEQRLEIAHEIGDRHGEDNALGNLGTAYHRLGQVEKAIGFYEQALVIDREIGDRRGEGSDLVNLGLAYADLGQVEKAIGLLEEALRIGEEIEDPQIISLSRSEIERLRSSSGNEPAANSSDG